MEPSFSFSVVLNSSPGMIGSMSAFERAPASTGEGSLHVLRSASMRRVWSLSPTTPYSDRIDSSTFSVPARLSQYMFLPLGSWVRPPPAGLQSMKPCVRPGWREPLPVFGRSMQSLSVFVRG